MDTPNTDREFRNSLRVAQQKVHLLPMWAAALIIVLAVAAGWAGQAAWAKHQAAKTEQAFWEGRLLEQPLSPEQALGILWDGCAQYHSGPRKDHVLLQAAHETLQAVVAPALPAPAAAPEPEEVPQDAAEPE